MRRRERERERERARGISCALRSDPRHDVREGENGRKRRHGRRHGPLRDLSLEMSNNAPLSFRGRISRTVSRSHAVVVTTKRRTVLRHTACANARTVRNVTRGRPDATVRAKREKSALRRYKHTQAAAATTRPRAIWRPAWSSSRKTNWLAGAECSARIGPLLAT